ncbi:MAG: sigma-54-dependent Fis family transcriptional regulator [Firmicutes bacterium]|nr:sigma-54-dependent Fis family transcriptional regulator [Bacillota bacterium]
MKDKEKTKQQLIDEIVNLREKNLRLENLVEINKRIKQVIGINSFNEILDNIQEPVIITNNQESTTERKPKEQELVKREVEFATRKAQQKIIRLKKVAAQQLGLEEIGFYSESMSQIYQLSQRYYLDRSIPVLIQGETGTGKEIVAKLIHYGDLKEMDQPFVDINCAALSPSLFESELFGYEAGAFTGSLAKGQKGKFDIADGGTIFLDEISELPLELQVKLLRVIQEKQFYRVGGLKKVKADVRIICATNKDLNQAVVEDKFRDDLYYRLKVGYINIPPLRERKEDILPLARMYLQEYSRQKGKSFQEFDPKAADILLSYAWPGNIRELKNVIEVSVFMHNGIKLKPEHLEFVSHCEDRMCRKTEIQCPEAIKKPYNNLVDELLFRTLEENKGNISRTARALGISRNTVYKKVKEYKNAPLKN